jgi:hypothetical protein
VSAPCHAGRIAVRLGECAVTRRQLLSGIRRARPYHAPEIPDVVPSQPHLDRAVGRKVQPRSKPLVAHANRLDPRGIIIAGTRLRIPRAAARMAMTHRFPCARRSSTGHAPTLSGNVRVGVAYFNQLLHEFRGNVRLALAAYVQGPRAVRTRGIFADTRTYVEGVLALSRRL